MSLSASSALLPTRSRISSGRRGFIICSKCALSAAWTAILHSAMRLFAVRKLNLLRIEEQLSAAHLRLARVYVECPPYHEVIKRYDKATTVFMWTRHIGIARTTMAKGSSAARTSPCWLNCWARLRGSSFFP